MQMTSLSPVGIAVDGIDLRSSLADPAALARTTTTSRRLLAEHGFAVFAGQRLDDDGFTTWLGAFGELVFTEGETPVEGHPELNVVSNVGRTTPPRSVFHVDTSYVSHPPAYTALRAVTVPEEGGQTVFSNQYRALETLPRDLRSRIEGRSIHHVVTGVEPGREQESEAWHPAVRSHPLTGRDALFLSTPERCVEVSGLSEDEGRDVVARLYEHSIAPANTRAHTWSPGDVVIWDNRCVLHRADHSGVVGDRVMHRGMVGDATVPAA